MLGSTKPALRHSFSRLPLARISRKSDPTILRENLTNDSLGNCDVGRATIFCRFKTKNVCIFSKYLSFQLFQSEIILVKCCKEVNVPIELIFFRISRVQIEIFLCASLCISSYEYKAGRKLPTFWYIIHIKMTACATAYRTICGKK